MYIFQKYIKQPKKYLNSYFVILLLTTLYLLFLSKNQVGDAYYYAYLSNNGTNLFEPHHLLYCLYGKILLKLFSFLHIAPIFILQSANALAAGGVLLVLRNILKKINNNEHFLISAILFCGSCFCFLRFATDNECYIIPLLFSMLAINDMQNYFYSNKISSIINAGIFCVFACLFHQLGILLCLTIIILLIAGKNIKSIATFLTICLLIPLTYYIINILQTGDWSLIETVKFTLRDYLKGTAQMPNIEQVVVLTLINLFRIFLQIHGYMLDMLSKLKFATIITAIASLALMFWGLLLYIKQIKQRKKSSENKYFIALVMIFLVLSVFFAAFSNGNAEFMIVIPFLIIMLYSLRYVQSRCLMIVALGMLLWNGYFALYPYAYENISANDEIATVVEKYPNAVFVLSEKQVVENILSYRTGYETTTKIYIASQYTYDDFLADKAAGKMIITDVVGSENAISRVKITQKSAYNFDSAEQIGTIAEFSGLGYKKVISEY